MSWRGNESIRDEIHAEAIRDCHDFREPLERPTADEVMPDGAWAFDEEVTACFDDMLARSIPQYEAMRDAVTQLAVRWLRKSFNEHLVPPLLVDLGSSRGEAVRPIVKSGVIADFLLTEVSTPMLDAARASFVGRPQVRVTECDLRDEYPVTRPASVVTAVLTLLFTPLEYRQHIVRSAYESLEPGGALVVVEKLLPDGPTLDRAQTELYYDLKHANGYSREAIAAKRKSLEGVQVCLTDAWNRELLYGAGFAEVDCFWRWMSFAGYVAVKGADR